jgi:hypothetical protein
MLIAWDHVDCPPIVKRKGANASFVRGVGILGSTPRTYYLVFLTCKSLNYYDNGADMDVC